jgi:lipoyl(octanoyl) transferase
MSTNSNTWSIADRASDALEVHLLGLVDFESALFLQERLVYEIAGRNDKLGALLICEHPPLVTVGREGSRAHILVDQRELTARQMEVRWLNRGGGCLVHAPGQLAVYPIVALDRLQLGLDAYRERLETAVCDVCGDLKLTGRRRDDEPGVWARSKQVAHVGVAVKSWVAHHGLFINVCQAPEFLRIVRANRTGQRPSSLAAERLRTTAMHEVRESVIRHVAARLGYEHTHLYTGHPLLRRTQRRIYVHA